MEKPILEVKNLKKYFAKSEGILGNKKSYNKAVDGIDFSIKKGETFGLVGESGCGKSTTGRSIIKLYNLTDGEVYFDGQRISVGEHYLKSLKQQIKDLPKGITPDVREKLNEIDALNEKIKLIEKKFAKEEQKQIRKLDTKDEQKVNDLREQFTIQRVEATKSYDDTIKRLQSESQALIEKNSTIQKEIIQNKIKALKVEYKKAKNDDKQKLTHEEKQEILEPLKKRVSELRVEIEAYKKTLPSKEDSTLVKLQAKLINAIEELETESFKIRKPSIPRKIQMIFQDPYASLNSRMTVADIIAEPLEIHNMYPTRKERRERVYELLNLVGLSKEHASRYPHEFSGGQRQRIGIARTLAVNPEFIVCDEPISALDVSIQAQIINLLEDLQEKLGLTYLFIAHDISMVKHISDRIGVMYLGNIVEIADSDELFNNTLHPYTQALLSAVPVPDIDKDKDGRITLEGDIPSPYNPPSGCKFRTRCQYATERCAKEVPELKEKENGHIVACHLVD